MSSCKGSLHFDNRLRRKLSLKGLAGLRALASKPGSLAARDHNAVSLSAECLACASNALRERFDCVSSTCHERFGGGYPHRAYVCMHAWRLRDRRLKRLRRLPDRRLKRLEAPRSAWRPKNRDFTGYTQKKRLGRLPAAPRPAYFPRAGWSVSICPRELSRAEGAVCKIHENYDEKCRSKAMGRADCRKYTRK